MIPRYRAWDNWRERMSVVDRIYIDTKGVRLHDDFGEYWRDLNDVNLMQSTGLRDKNGKEIFEGDIIDSEDGILSGIVEFRPDLGMFVSTLIKYNNFERLCNVADSVYIIGNIYTNPELAEVSS